MTPWVLVCKSNSCKKTHRYGLYLQLKMEVKPTSEYWSKNLEANKIKSQSSQRNLHRASGTEYREMCKFRSGKLGLCRAGKAQG